MGDPREWAGGQVKRGQPQVKDPERMLEGAQLIFTAHGSEKGRVCVCIYTLVYVCLCVSDGVSARLSGDVLHSPHKIST